MAIFIEISGWIGMACILLAYFLVSNKKIRSASHVYQGLNAIGAINLLANAIFHYAWPLAALNVAWLIIALVALIRPAKSSLSRN